MTPRLRLRTIELRHVLTLYLFQHSPTTVTDVIDALHYQAFEIPGRASKAVSDALRSEIANGRVHRLKRGLYGPGSMPRATDHRIHQRVLALREEAAAIAGRDDDAFWDALGA